LKKNKNFFHKFYYYYFLILKETATLNVNYVKKIYKPVFLAEEKIEIYKKIVFVMIILIKKKLIMKLEIVRIV
jgi:hypothetical protein